MNDFQKEEAFQAFVAENRPYWVRISWRVLGNREEAEDAVQETLVILWEGRDRLGVENPGAYAARAVWLNSLKRRARRKEHLPLEMAEKVGTETPEVEFASGRVKPGSLERALENLPEAQKTVLVMKYTLGLSFKEIGEALEISLNTAGSRCRYALAALRAALGAHRHPPEETRKGSGLQGESHE
jgi:RNA polymerase sigma-70 factor (ECF subfamily)